MLVVSVARRLGSEDRVEVRARQFVPDSSLEGTGFEPSVPLLRKALLGVANRSRRHDRRRHLQVQIRNGNACLDWLPTAFAFAEGPRVRIRGESATNSLPVKSSRRQASCPISFAYRIRVVSFGALPAGLIRAARDIVGGAKAVTRPKLVEQPTRICLSIYRGTAGTLYRQSPRLGPMT